LIPSWAKDDKISRHTYNARSETAAEKPSYRHAWRQSQVGLVLADNFYEPSYASGKAVRWKIELASGDPFGIACLWERWTDPASGELVVSFSMLTVNADAHPVMRQFHKPWRFEPHWQWIRVRRFRDNKYIAHTTCRRHRDRRIAQGLWPRRHGI
jgi:putative SOS response-associated peptidase YedK